MDNKRIAKYKCPCYGYETLTEKYDPYEGTGYDICRLCGWEDDGTVNIELHSSVNRDSILNYRKKNNIKPNLK